MAVPVRCPWGDMEWAVKAREAREEEGGEGRRESSGDSWVPPPKGYEKETAGVAGGSPVASLGGVRHL